MGRCYISLIVLMLSWLITFNDGTKLRAEKANWFAYNPWIETQVDGKRVLIPWAAIKTMEEL